MDGADGAVILGMSRSGTSAVTAMFIHAGFYAGAADELMPASDANPGGFWENTRIWQLNEQILRDLDGSWLAPPTTESQVAATAWACRAIRGEVEHILSRAGGSPSVIKDPRIGVMTRLWDPIIGGRLHPVLVVRDPTEIADSLYRRDGTPPQLGLAGWELHMCELLGYLDGRAVTVAPYDLLLRDQAIARSIVESAAAHIAPAMAARVRPERAAAALKRAFRQSEASERDGCERLTAGQLRLWSFLCSLEHGNQVLSVPEAVRGTDAVVPVGVACEAKRLRAAAKHAGQLQAAREHVAQLAEALEATGQAGFQREAMLAAARQRAEGAERAAAAQTNRGAELEGLLTAERERVTIVEAALEQALADLAGAHAALRDIKGSASWKLTRPLRFAKRHARFASRTRVPAEHSCEIHVPISPTPSFVTRVRYLAASVRRFGGTVADAPVIVTVGGDDPFDLARRYPWSRELGIEWRWVEEPLWREHGPAATAIQRFRYDIEAPTALMLDADTLVIAPIDELVTEVAGERSVAGVAAHVSPFVAEEEGQALWDAVFREAGLPRPAMTCEHSGWQAMEFDPDRRFCPPYFNLGVVLASRETMATLGRSILADMEAVQRVRSTFFRCQLALTLAIVRSGISWRQLPLRFNFPNDLRFLPRNQRELQDARIIHYLREDQLNRDGDFRSPDTVSALLSRDRMHLVNARFCEALREVHEHVLGTA